MWRVLRPGAYALERVWPTLLTDAGSLCELANLSARCREKDRSYAEQLSADNSHSSTRDVQRLTWREARRADGHAARLVRKLGERLGYQYGEEGT